jgi:hypothetical protein
LTQINGLACSSPVSLHRSAVRDGISGPGTWAFLPARLPTGETVVINAGFLQNTMQDRGQRERAEVRLITCEPVMLTGYIHFPETSRTLGGGCGGGGSVGHEAQIAGRVERAP